MRNACLEQDQLRSRPVYIIDAEHYVVTESRTSDLLRQHCYCVPCLRCGISSIATPDMFDQKPYQLTYIHIVCHLFRSYVQEPSLTQPQPPCTPIIQSSTPRDSH